MSARRDVAAAKAFFRKAVKSRQRPPQTITLDGYAASHRAVRELRADSFLPTDTKLRSSKYLNNLRRRDLDVAGLALGTAPPATTQPLKSHDPALHVEHVLAPAVAAGDRHADETRGRRIHAPGERATLDAPARVTRVTRATKRRASDHRPLAASCSTLASAWFSTSFEQTRAARPSVLIRRSKGDHEGQGQEVATPRGYKLRPVEAVQTWLAAAEISAGPVFRAVALGGRVSDVALAGDSAARTAKRYGRRVGLDAASHAGNSLRGGFLTSAAETGASIWKLSEVSRYESLDALRGYMQRVDLFKEHAGGGAPATAGGPNRRSGEASSPTRAVSSRHSHSPRRGGTLVRRAPLIKLAGLTRSSAARYEAAHRPGM